MSTDQDLQVTEPDIAPDQETIDPPSASTELAEPEPIIKAGAAPDDGIVPDVKPEKPPPRPPRPDGQPRTKIAILGTTPSRMQGPIDDLEWDIWTIGPGGKDAHGWDKLFEVHHVWPENFKDYLNDLSQVEPPQEVITLQPAPMLIHQWAIDQSEGDEAKRVELLQHLKGNWSANKVLEARRMTTNFFRSMWFSSSIAYCIGAAIEMRDTHGVTDIGFWGIDLESGEEYISQYTGAAHLIDVARHLGINVHLPPGCGLDRDIKPYPDRYENNLAMTMEKKHAWLSNSVAQLEGNFKMKEADMYKQEGVIMAMEAGKAPEDHIKKAKENHAHLNHELAQIGANLNHLKGELSATQYYRRMFIWGIVDPDEPVNRVI